MILNKIKDRIGNYNGMFGLYYIDLNSGEKCRAGNCDVFRASGTVKLLTLVEAFKRLEEKSIEKNFKYRLKKSDYIQSASQTMFKTFGALEFLHEGIELTFEDLYKLNTTVSDNIAFNILLRILGIDEINRTMSLLGYTRTRVNREIYNDDKIKKGIENYISLEEVANLFYRMHKGQLISRNASREMIMILKEHQKNNIIPYNFSEATEIAHQTGIDEGSLLDIGIVYCRNPFVLCMAAEDTNTRQAESMMRDLTAMCYKNSNASKVSD